MSFDPIECKRKKCNANSRYSGFSLVLVHYFVLELEMWQLGQGRTVQRLQFSGEFRRARNDDFHLLLAFCPGPVHRGFLARQVRLHVLKLLRDCDQPFVELRTHEILKDSRFLVVLAAECKPCLPQQRDVYSQGFCQAGC